MPLVRICAGALGNWRPYRDRTEADRKITSEPRSLKQIPTKTRKTESTEKCAQKGFDGADIVRDLRLPAVAQGCGQHLP
jgi:hypothetical protein